MTVLKFEINKRDGEVWCEEPSSWYMWTPDDGGWGGAEDIDLSYDQALWLAERFEEIDLGDTSLDLFWKQRAHFFKCVKLKVHENTLKQAYKHTLREQPKQTKEEEFNWKEYYRKVLEENDLIEKHLQRNKGQPSYSIRIHPSWGETDVIFQSREEGTYHLFTVDMPYPEGVCPSTSVMKVSELAGYLAEYPKEETPTEPGFVTEQALSENPCAEILTDPKIQRANFDAVILDESFEALERKVNKLSVERAHRETLAAYHEAQKPVTKPRQRKVEWVLSDSAALNLTKRT